ncbi:MAG: hypothetical protein K5978_02115, partial [Campylobacter sp.]|nr:hypothetical protein [Campylobacter sp.]
MRKKNFRYTKIHRNAFSVVEIIAVIIIVSILIYIAMPKRESASAHLAAEQILSHIRYTRHLALIDDKY